MTTDRYSPFAAREIRRPRFTALFQQLKLMLMLSEEIGLEFSSFVSSSCEGKGERIALPVSLGQSRRSDDGVSTGHGGEITYTGKRMQSYVGRDPNAAAGQQGG